uniref:ATP synthase F0 subunit 8 n=1 Tax=Empoascanara circumscripta TaxID=3057150 RepID=A0AA51NHH9_9HEMI|nr:ATP synthase F0 subunit 8 [Empoascanara circumscripta]WMQ52390.1 ATP synthase F0 subunit 8 [Empoascanara circumscripta]
MPQMSPMWWTFMMMLFILCFMLMMTIMYFEFKMKINYNTKLNYKMMKWKW